MATLSEALDRLEDEYGFAPIGISCDGGCGERLTRHDESHAKYVRPMTMVLCPNCAEEAGWLD